MPSTFYNMRTEQIYSYLDSSHKALLQAYPHVLLVRPSYRSCIHHCHRGRTCTGFHTCTTHSERNIGKLPFDRQQALTHGRGWVHSQTVRQTASQKQAPGFEADDNICICHQNDRSLAGRNGTRLCERTSYFYLIYGTPWRVAQTTESRSREGVLGSGRRPNDFSRSANFRDFREWDQMRENLQTIIL